MNFQEFLARKRALALVEHMNTLSEADAQQLFDSLDAETVEFIETVLNEGSLGAARTRRTFDVRSRQHYQQHNLPYPGDFKDPISFSHAVAKTMKNPYDPAEVSAITQKIENLPQSRPEIISQRRLRPRRAEFEQRYTKGVENKLNTSLNPDATASELHSISKKLDQDTKGEIKLDPQEKRDMIKSLVSIAKPKPGLAQRNTTSDELAPRVTKGREETTKERMLRLAGERLAKHGPYQ